MRLVIGGDHAGFSLKGPLIEHLRNNGHEVHDIGSFTPDPVDFPDICSLLCKEVQSGNAERGILVCGTGIGASIGANKFPGIRAALAHDIYSAHQCVEHDNANVLCMGAQIVGYKVAFDLVDSYLLAQFSTEEEFRRRVEKLAAIDKLDPSKR